jgi:hypothetical protein
MMRKDHLIDRAQPRARTSRAQPAHREFRRPAHPNILNLQQFPSRGVRLARLHVVQKISRETKPPTRKLIDRFLRAPAKLCGAHNPMIPLSRTLLAPVGNRCGLEMMANPPRMAALAQQSGKIALRRRKNGLRRDKNGLNRGASALKCDKSGLARLGGCRRLAFRRRVAPFRRRFDCLRLHAR